MGNQAAFEGRLREARESKGMTHGALAAAAGINNRQTIAHLENGAHEPSLEQVRQLAEALGCKPAWLAGWEGE